MNNKTFNLKHLSKNNSNSQAGVSVIELLISITMGVFLVAGVVTGFIGAKDSDKMRFAVSEMDANARVAMGALRQTILHAGYTSMYNVRLEKAFYTASDGILTNQNCRNAIQRDANTPIWANRTRDSGRTDVITVISLADNPCNAGLATCPSAANVNPDAHIYYDCVGGGADRDHARVVACSTDPTVGMMIPTEAKIYSTFWVNHDRDLMCRGNRGNTQPLVQNVEFMQILYGVKLDNGNTSYRKANDNDQWGLVNSVQIALLIRSSTNILKEPSSKTSYVLLDERRHIDSVDLHRLFRLYTTTINLENRSKGALL